MLEAVKQNGLALLYLMGMQKYENVLLEAVGQNGLALEYVWPIYKTPTVVDAAIAQNKDANKFLRERIKPCLYPFFYSLWMTGFHHKLFSYPIHKFTFLFHLLIYNTFDNKSSFLQDLVR